jgi:hypothetical protein
MTTTEYIFDMFRYLAVVVGPLLRQQFYCVNDLPIHRAVFMSTWRPYFGVSRTTITIIDGIVTKQQFITSMNYFVLACRSECD